MSKAKLKKESDRLIAAGYLLGVDFDPLETTLIFPDESELTFHAMDEEDGCCLGFSTAKPQDN